MRAHAQEKLRIAQATAAMIKPGETVFLGSGTTATQVLSHVDPDLHARIITHNLGAVSSAQEKALDVILLGGLYRPRSNTLEGALSLEVLSGFHASKFILGADGVSLEEGITTASVGLAGVERAMIRQTRGEVIVLADRSKIGVVGDFVDLHPRRGAGGRRRRRRRRRRARGDAAPWVEGGRCMRSPTERI